MKVKIVEVGPRDGLQNEKQIIALEKKVDLIQSLFSCNILNIESGSFVKVDKIPQMKDSEEVWNLLSSEIKAKCNLSFLVPNMRGLERAQQIKVDSLAFFTSTSETFNEKNINASIEKSLERFEEIYINRKDCKIRFYISTVFGCPYEKDINLKNLLTILEKIKDLEIEEVSLGDTIGVAHPKLVKEVLKEASAIFPKEKLAVHFHDTFGHALSNIVTALEEGINVIDSSIGGLGGCPYAKGATGNVATEEVVYLLEKENINTGIDLDKLLSLSVNVRKEFGKYEQSKLLKALNL